MKDIMVVYAEHLAENNRPPHDEKDPIDRQRFEDFRAGFVQGVNGAMLEVRDSCLRSAAIARISALAAVHGRN